MVPVSYSYRNLIVRWKTTLMTASGFTLVVAALTIMLAFVKGIEQVCATSGEPENVVVLSQGTTDEILSQLTTANVTQIESAQGIARDSQNRPLASRELFMIVQRELENGKSSMLQLRGVLPVAFDVHRRLRVVEGRALEPGRGEILLGTAVRDEQKLNVGDAIRLGTRDWKVVGVFESGGSTLDSEVWVGLSDLASQFRREGVVNSVVVRAPNDSSAKQLASQLAAGRSVSVTAMTEPDYFAKQAETTNMIVAAAWVIAWFMGIGAIFGIMNTMFAAIGQRTKDIAVMRILGYQPTEILVSFLLEAILISLFGGGLGAALGYATNGLTKTVTVAAREIEFAFYVDSRILGLAIAFSLSMGILGGILPALSSMRIRPLEALR